MLYICMQVKAWPIMLNILLISYAFDAQKLTHYMLNIMPITTAIVPQFTYNLRLH